MLEPTFKRKRRVIKDSSKTKKKTTKKSICRIRKNKARFQNNKKETERRAEKYFIRA